MFAKGRHATRPDPAPGPDAARDRDASEDTADGSAPKPPGARRALWALFWAVGVVSLGIVGLLVYGAMRLDDDMEHPGDGFSGWQCAATSGPCEEDRP